MVELFPGFSFGPRPRRGMDSCPVLNERLFMLQLMRERARTDRVGGRFLLLVIDVDGDGGELDDDLRELLARIAAKRTRLSDLTGWIEGHVGVLLPETDSGAVPGILHKIRESFMRQLASLGTSGRPLPRVVHEVYTYPGTDSEAARDFDRDGSTMKAGV